MEVGLGPGHNVLHGDPALPRKGHNSPQFSARVYCGQTVGWTKMPLGTEVGLGPGDVVLDGDPAPSKKAQQPHASAHVYCGQTVGCIRMPLGMEVGLGLGHTVSDGDQLPRSAQPPIFGPCLLRPNGWMDHGATFNWYGGTA